MKKNYETPEMTLVRMSLTDVILSSPTDKPTDYVVIPDPSEFGGLEE